jgi:hypothetical protein
VSTDDVRLYGRGTAIRLVREFLTRGERDGTPVSRQYPVLVFTGPRGSGKTALVTKLKQLLDRNVPCARIDCEGFDGGAAELLPLLAFELNRHSGRYGRVPFPRLITGLIAMSVELDDVAGKADRPAARQRMRKALEDRKDTARALQATIQEAIQAGLNAVGGTPPGVTDILTQVGPRLVLGWLVTIRPGRRIVLGAGQDWYVRQDREDDSDPIDALIDLNLKAAGILGKDTILEAEDLLWAAFLADLDDAFARWRSVNWTLNCLVLLDNADAPAGSAFLDELVAVRRRRAAAGMAPAPLTVVATSRGPVTEQLIPRGGRPTTLADASYADYERRGAEGSELRWGYRVALPDLAPEDVGAMARELELPAGTGRTTVAAAIYRYTHGHPGCTRRLLNEVAVTHNTNLAAILDSAGPGDPPLADRLLDDMLAGASEQTVEDLVTFSAARNKEAAMRLSSENEPWDEHASAFNASFWDESRPAVSQALHPVLRRLLLRRLGMRGADAHPGGSDWAGTHARLRKISLETGDETGVLYHMLALGEVEQVARRLAEAVRTLDAEKWLRLLEAVTAAPNNLRQPRKTAREVYALTKWTDPGDVLVAATGRLVAAMWIGADPLSEPGKAELNAVMRAAMAQIAPYSRDGIAVLHEYAEKAYADDPTWNAGSPRRQGMATRSVSFDPPVSWRGAKRSRRIKGAAAALALALAAGTATGIYLAVAGPATCGPTQAPFQLVWNGGECVGVTDGSYVFDPGNPAIATIEHDIEAANASVVSGGNYVTIALLTPLTEPPGGTSDVSLARIADELRGAYLAQQYVNTEGNLPFGVRLMLANEGSSEQGEAEAVSQLKQLTAFPGRLLAVAGMGISVQATETAAQALGVGGSDIPMFGAVTTADPLDNTTNADLVRVVPDVDVQLKALLRVLRQPGQPLAPARRGAAPPRVVLVYDRNTQDLYTSSLRKDFENAFPSGLSPDTELPYVSGGPETKGVFGAIARALCPSSAAQPPVVLYAGRESVLGDFVGQLQGAGNCVGKQVTVVTGSDANALSLGSTLSDAGGAQVTVVYSDIEPDHVTSGFQHIYQQWIKTTDGMTDPWLIATYNAMTAAWNAIHLGAVGDPQQPSQLTAGDVANALPGLYIGDSLEGATGNFSITTNGDLNSDDVPIIRLADGKKTILDH